MLTTSSFRVVLCASVLGLCVLACGSVSEAPEGADDLYGARIDTRAGAEEESDEGSGSDGPMFGDVGEADGALVGANDVEVAADLEQLTALASASAVRTTANVNLRKGPGASYSVVAVIPSGTELSVVTASPSNGFLNVKFNGLTGWSSAAYLTGAASSSGTSPADIDGPPSPENAIARAKTAVGFSYYWGFGVWLPSGATRDNAGSCSGNCPSCTHSGRYGADCSGLVAKAWQLGTKAIDVNSHPYSTFDFVKNMPGKWSIISRASLKKGDSLVYNENGAGHMVIVEKGDPWGALTVYECRGCAYGCTYGTRTFASNYKAIRRVGF